MMLVLLLLPCLLLCAGAAEVPKVLDWESLLTDTEESALLEAIGQLKETYGIDVMIVTKDSYDGDTAQQHADDLYDFQGGGEDGVLFLLSLAQREWYISTCGKMIYVLTDYGIQQIGEEAAAYFGNGDYYGGFAVFLESLPYYLDAYGNNAPVDGYADYSGSYYHGDAEDTVYYDYETESSPNFFISLVIGLAAAGISIGVMKSAMNTKRAQRDAGVYVKQGSYHLRTHQDLFLYSNVTKTRRQQNTGGSSGRPGGGSSIHRSSGGRSHGGGGGRF